MNTLSKIASICFKGCCSRESDNRLLNLHNGEQVSTEILKTTFVALEKLKNHEFRFSLELHLLRKAIDPSYYFPTTAECAVAIELKKLHLVDSHGEMRQEIAHVIKNCFAEESSNIIGINPFTGTRLRRDSHWTRLLED